MKEIAKLDGKWFDTLYAHDCTYHCVSCVEAGVCLADKWLSYRTKVIDFWGCQHYSRELVEGFLQRLYENGVLDSFSDVKWYFNECTTHARQEFDGWVGEFMKNISLSKELSEKEIITIEMMEKKS